MKKILLLLSVLAVLAACNKPGGTKSVSVVPEETKPVVNQTKEGITMKEQENFKPVYYQMNACGQLEKAVLANDAEAVKRLLANGAEEGDKFCALNSAIERGFIDPGLVNMKIVKLLLAAKTNVNAKLRLPTDYEDNFLLEKATRLGSATLVQLLLEAGADAKSKDRALSLAVRDNRVEIVKLLLSAGVTNEAKDDAYSYAINLQHVEIAKLLSAAGAKNLNSGISKKSNIIALD